MNLKTASLLLLTLWPLPLLAQEEYRDYKFARQQSEYFAIEFSNEQVTITAFGEIAPVSKTFPRKSIKIVGSQVECSGTVFFTPEGMNLDGKVYAYERISESRITDDKDKITITFLTRSADDSGVVRFKRGNLVTYDENIIVRDDDFIRGIALSIIGDIEVLGEINKDVVSLFGDIYIGPEAVARGDIASVTGHVEVARDAAIYGEIFSFEKKGWRRKHRFARETNKLSISGSLRYNRVDGLGVYGVVEYDDLDSLLPRVSTRFGYGFASERWRYGLGIEQTLWRNPNFVVGGKVYRELASGDDWLLDNGENTVFALLVTEDFKDYYEAEGGILYFKVLPMPELRFETGYEYEETKWLYAHRFLWSLFGGDKLFPHNYGSVPSPFLEQGIAEIDSTTNGYWYNRVEYSTVDEESPFDNSAWRITGELEWADNSFSSDFDYRRYTLGVRRYQKLNRRAMLLMRGILGGSDGYLPMYKRFFVGGLGTLYGYNHKEFMGTRFWMTNVEYRFSFPKSDLAASVFWDMAQIANDTKLNGDVEVKHDLGVGLYIGDDFRFNIAQRLDRGEDNDPEIYVRLAHVF